jgi:hypothetical protein
MPLKLLIRNIVVFSDEFKTALERTLITDDNNTTPGQLRKKGEMYYLTYLRMHKLKDFDAKSWGDIEREIMTIRVIQFMIDNGKLFVYGMKSDLKQLLNYFESIALQCGAPNADGELNLEKYCKIVDLNVDLGALLKTLEELECVQDIKKLKMNDLQVSAGTIKHCVIDTQDYGAAKSIIIDQENPAVALQIILKKPAQTELYVSLEAEVFVQSKNENADLDSLAREFALLL